MKPCPSTEDLSGYLSGSCADNVAVRIEEHLQSCSRCIEWCGQATIDDDLHGRLRQVLDHDANQKPSSPSGGEFPIGSFDSQAMTSSSAPRFTPGAGESDAYPSIEGYELLHEIGRGGMGVVHLAYQKSTKRKVALKVLLQGPFASTVAKRRFEREIELAALLDHPHIVNVLESGIAEGRYYFAMRYVEGERLDRYLSRSGATIRETLALFVKVCDAVSYAHRKGVIHRDLKPSNILVGQSGEPCVMDFGLAKVHDPEAQEDATLLSMEGELLGTIPYMAPEQTTGSTRDVDTRTDVYALGVLLYRLLTGDYPYRVTGGIQEALRNINEVDPTRPSSGRSDIDDDVDTIVLTALQKDPSHRYPSADNLARDVERYLEGKPIDAKRDSFAYVLRKTLARHRLGVAVSITVALAAGVALWMGVSERRQRIRMETNSIVTALGANVTDAMNRMAEADGATKALLTTTVGRLVASPSRDERSTGARGGLLINPEAFWRSVDGGPLWQSGEWLELCSLPPEVQDAMMDQLRLHARTGSARQKYVAYCLIGQMVRPVAGVAEMCQKAAMVEDDPGVAAAAMWAARRLGMKVDPPNSERVFVDELSGMTYVRIPGASRFRRGSDGTDPDRDPVDEERAKSAVAIAPIFMGQTEVTWLALDEFLSDPATRKAFEALNPKLFDKVCKWRDSALNLLTPNERSSAVAAYFPHSIARKYCLWLSKRGKDAEPPRRYRLPTEDEWEYACRAGASARFCFGHDETHARYFANCNGSSAGQSHTAATKMPNAFGLFDMHGGMWEWTGSLYPRELAKGVPESAGDLWVYRGGASYSPAVRCRSAQRNYGEDNVAWDYHGFRLVMELIEP